ncbi:MAG: hypothetical protein ACTSRZ_03290 [Promethearchaeota archaeon]
MTEEIAKISNLNKDELKLYSYAVARGYMTKSMVLGAFKWSEKKATELIDSLVEKKVLKQISGVVPRYIPISPFNEFLSSIEEFQNNINKNRDELIKIRQNSEEIFNKLAEESTRIVERSIKDAISVAEEDKMATTGLIAQNLGNVKQITEDLTQKTLETISNKKKQNIQNFKKTIEETIKSNEEDLSTLMKEKYSAIEDLIFKIKQNIDEYQDSFRKSIEEISADREKQEQTTLQEIKNQLNVLFEIMDKNNKEFNSLTLDNLQNSLKAIESIIKTEEETSKNTILSVKNAVGAKLSEINTELSKILSNTNSAIGNSKQTLINSLQTQHKAISDGISTGLKDISVETDNSIIALKNDSIKKISDQIANAIVQMKQNKTDWKQNISDLIENIILNLKEGTEQIKDTISSSIQSEIKKYKEEVVVTLEKIQQEYLNRIEQAGNEYEITFKNALNDKIVDFADILKKKTMELEEKTAKSIENEENSLNEVERSINSEISSSMDDVKQKINETLDKNSTNALNLLEKSYNELSKNSEQSLSRMLEVLTFNSQILQDQFNKSLNNVKASLDEESAKLAVAIEERIQKLNTTTSDRLKNNQKIVADAIEKNKAEISQKFNGLNRIVDESRTLLKKTIDEFNRNINSELNSIHSHINENITPVKSKFDSLFEDLKNTLTFTSSKIVEFYTNSVENATASINSDIEKYNTDAIEILTNAQKIVDESFDKLIDLSRKASETIKDKIGNAIYNRHEKIQQTLESIINKINTNLEECVQNADKPKEVLIDISKIIINSEIFDAEKSWIIVGDEPIYNYLEDMIKRTKSAGYLVVPKFDVIDIKLIMDIHQKGRKFWIVTDLQTAKKPKLVNQAHESGIELFDYNKKDFIAYIRDSEEILIAAIAPQEDEITAIVSEATPMIEHLSKMFQDYWRKISKKFTPI